MIPVSVASSAGETARAVAPVGDAGDGQQEINHQVQVEEGALHQPGQLQGVSTTTLNQSAPIMVLIGMMIL